jgi:iron complex outermembrane receptor protein
MSRPRYSARSTAAGVCAVSTVLVLNAGGAPAQTVLAPVEVTAPTPIARPKPAAPAASGARSAQASPKPSTPKPASPATLQVPPGISLTLSAEPSFSAVTVLGRPDIIASPSATLADTLATQPGISATSFAPGASRPVIRGLGGFRVSVQENGIGTGDVQKLSDDHAVPLDPFAAERVEVVRGPATLRYGSQAIGGVVNASNSRIPEEVPREGFRAETTGGLTSGRNGRDGGALIEAGSGNFVIHADTYYRAADDYMTPQGKQANTSYSGEGYSLGGSYVFSKGYFGVAYSSFSSTYFIPGTEAAADKNHIVLDQTKWTSKGEWRVHDYGIDAIRTWLGALDYKHNEVDGLGANAVIGSTFLDRQYEARIEVQHLPVGTMIGELRGAMGVQWTDRKLSAAGDEGILLDPTHTRNLGAYLFEELQLTRALRLQAAVRIESSDVRGVASTFPDSYLPPPNDPDQSAAHSTFVPKSASLGLLYDLPLGLVARITAQHVERAPDATELFYKGPHDSTQTFEIGDPNLKIEKADTAEIGLKRSKGRFRFDASAYATNFTNFIYKRFTGAQCDGDFASCGSGSELDQIVYAQRDATFYGAELQAEYDVAPIWRGVWGVSSQYDFVHATFSDGTYVPKISPHRLGGGLFYRDGNWLARVNLLHAFRQDEIATFETPTSGYNMLNAEISYTMALPYQGGASTSFTIGLKGENLLDDDVRNHVSYKKDDVLQPGTSVRLFGTIRYN